MKVVLIVKTKEAAEFRDPAASYIGSSKATRAVPRKGRLLPHGFLETLLEDFRPFLGHSRPLFSAENSKIIFSIV